MVISPAALSSVEPYEHFERLPKTFARTQDQKRSHDAEINRSRDNGDNPQGEKHLAAFSYRVVARAITHVRPSNPRVVSIATRMQLVDS
jgi:hypothetical protein